MRIKKHKKKINKLTFGLFDTLIDLTLFGSYIILQGGRNELFDTISKAIHATKITHPNSLKRAIYKATTKGYLERKEDYLKITKLGKERLSRIMPVYEEKRPWDGKLYLITYDVPEERKKDRDYLRDYLKKLNCGMLQHSVWLTPYNPKKIIADLVKQIRLVGLVLVSELKEGSGIGGRGISDVVWKVYGLEKLNEEYRTFVKQVEAKKLAGTQLIINYLSILKKDPQLPFELIPNGWWGDVAYDVYRKELIGLKKEMGKHKKLS